jgi:hypothetical protein
MNHWRDKEEFKERVLEWAAKLETKASAIYIRPMRRKWASCSTAGTLSFNDEPIGMDRELGNYVIIHESLHFSVPNHGWLWKSLMRAHLGNDEELEDRSGAVWVGTATDGLFRCDAMGAKRVETAHREVVSLAQDSEGNVWAGTAGGGLNRVRPRGVELQGTAAGLPFATLRSVCADESGRVWAVTLTGELAREEEGRWRTVALDEPGSGLEGDVRGGRWTGRCLGGHAAAWDFATGGREVVAHAFAGRDSSKRGARAVSRPGG